MSQEHSFIGGAVACFKSVRLGDLRLTRRVQRFVAFFAKNPAATVPEIFHDDAELEAAYRLLNNSRVHYGSLMNSVYEATAAKAATAENPVLVLHDTTTFEFHGEVHRNGLGHLNSKQDQGFLGHFSLAVEDSAEPRPLGVLAFEPIVREQVGKRRTRTRTEIKKSPDCESARWARAATAARRRLPANVPIVHVMDTEADIYELLCEMKESGPGTDFVVRQRYDRRVVETEDTIERPTVGDRLGAVEFVAFRDVLVSRRPGEQKSKKRKKGPKGLRKYPAREARTAKLSVRATKVELRRPLNVPSGFPVSLPINVVEVRELEPPENCEPVEWKLMTTLPVDTVEQIERVVDTYRRRWLIEEFFKAIKTGCAYEQRQLESAHSLLNMLALTSPVATQLLTLRACARERPTAPATLVFEPLQIDLLRRFSSRPPPENATIQDAVLAVAALGGHIKNNGAPGWLVLYRGFRRLLEFEMVWRAATASPPIRSRSQKRKVSENLQ